MGRYQIDGVDQESGFGTTLFVEAANEKTAAAKAEQQGVIATDIVLEGHPVKPKPGKRPGRGTDHPKARPPTPAGPRMWKVSGVHRRRKRELSVYVKASNEENALAMGQAHGLIVTAATALPRKARPEGIWHRPIDSKMIGGGIVAVLLLWFAFAIAFSDSGASSSRSVTTPSATRPARPDRGTNQASAHRSTDLEWYQGGTLHNVKMSAWRSASFRDRFATAADFATAFMLKDGLPIDSMDDLKPYARNLEFSISDVGASGVSDHRDVSEVAAVCWILMREGFGP